MEVDSELEDFFLSRARYLNTSNSVFEMQVASRWHDFWRNKRRLPDGTAQQFLKTTESGHEFDIANMDFEQLPAEFQAMTFVTTKLLCPMIEQRSALCAGKSNPFELPPTKSKKQTDESSAYNITKIKLGSFLDRCGALLHRAYMQRHDFIGYNNEPIPEWKDLSDQERQYDLGFVLMAVEVFLDPKLSQIRKESPGAEQAAAYRRLYKTKLNISVYGFGEQSDAQYFVDSGSVRGGAKLGGSGASFGKFIDMPALAKRRERVRDAIRAGRRRKAAAEAGDTAAPVFASSVFQTDASAEVVDLFNGWLSCQHHEAMPTMPSDFDPLTMIPEQTTPNTIDLTAMSVDIARAAGFIRFQRRFREIMATRAAAEELGEPFTDPLSQRTCPLRQNHFAATAVDEFVNDDGSDSDEEVGLARTASFVGLQPIATASADDSLEGEASVKPGGSLYTTPPRVNCALHLRVQWRRHAFKVPTADRVVPALDYGTAVSQRNDPLARITGLLKALERFDTDNSSTINTSEMLSILAANGVELDSEQGKKIVDRLDRNGDGEIDVTEFLRWQQKTGYIDKSDEAQAESQQAILDALVPAHVIRSSFGPHKFHDGTGIALGGAEILDTASPAVGSLDGGNVPSGTGPIAESKHSYIGVPASAVLKFQGGHDQVTFFDYFKSDPKLFDEASRVHGCCFTTPPACDRVLSVYGVGRETERHAFYKRSPCISSTDGDHMALRPDHEATMDNFVTKDGVAFETKDTPQLRCDTGDVVYTSGDGTVPYNSLRWPATWNRSRLWRKQRRIMLNSGLDCLFDNSSPYAAPVSPDEEEACEVDSIEFPGLDHRDMLGAKILKTTLAAVVNPTLQLRVGRLHSYWNSLVQCVGGESSQHRYKGVRLQNLRWYWEFELLPKDPSKFFAGKSGADYVPPGAYTMRTDPRYVMALAGIPPEDQQKSRSPTTSPRHGPATPRKFTSLNGDDKQMSECDFAGLLAFDPALDLTKFVGVSGKLKFFHTNKTYAKFVLTSKQINHFAGSCLQILLSDGRGLLQVECNIHLSGEYSSDRLRWMADAPPEPVVDYSDAEITSEEAVRAMHELHEKEGDL